MLQPEQHPTGHLPGLERHDSMLVGGLHIAQSAIERVAGGADKMVSVHTLAIARLVARSA